MMKKLSLLIFTLLLTSCTHSILYRGVVCEVRKEYHNIYGKYTKYVIVVSKVDMVSLSGEVEICTNEPYSVGDTVVFTKY